MWAGYDPRLDAWVHFGQRRYTEAYGVDAEEVTVVEADTDATHWGWLRTDGDAPTMIQPRRVLFDIQFPYGTDAETAAGKGEVVRLAVIADRADAPAGTGDAGT
jgi:hypothetical protein